MPSSNSPVRQHLEWNVETDSDDQDVTIVRLRGSAGVGSEAEFASCIRAIEKLQSSTVVLELSQLTFISSAAMGGLIVIKKSIEDRHGSLRLTHVPPYAANRICLLIVFTSAAVAICVVVAAMIFGAAVRSRFFFVG